MRTHGELLRQQARDQAPCVALQAGRQTARLPASQPSSYCWVLRCVQGVRAYACVPLLALVSCLSHPATACAHLLRSLCLQACITLCLSVAVCCSEDIFKEIDILCGLNHENVVYLKEYFEEGNKVREARETGSSTPLAGQQVAANCIYAAAPGSRFKWTCPPSAAVAAGV